MTSRSKDVIAGLIEMGQAAALCSEFACYYLANGLPRGNLHGLKEDSSRFQYWAAKTAGRRQRHSVTAGRQSQL